jgi:hypothetical protein
MFVERIRTSASAERRQTLMAYHTYQVEYTDTFGGEANYSWVTRETVTMPELTHYGYDGATNYTKCVRVYERELMKRAKATMGLTGVRGTSTSYGDSLEFRPYRCNTVMFVTFMHVEGEASHNG